MQTPKDVAQDKIKVRLEIVPEKQTPENKELTTEIVEDICRQFDQTWGYEVKPPYTGEMGVGHEIWIWVVPSVLFIGETVAVKLTEMATEKVADQLREFIKNFRHHTKLRAGIEVDQASSEVKATIHTEDSRSPDE